MGFLEFVGGITLVVLAIACVIGVVCGFCWLRDLRSDCSRLERMVINLDRDQGALYRRVSDLEYAAKPPQEGGAA